MEGADVGVQGFGEITDEGGADGMPQEGFNDLPDPSGGDSGKKKGLQRLVDGRLVGSEGLKYLLGDRAATGSGNPKIFNHSQVGGPGAGVEAVAGVGPLVRGFVVPGQIDHLFSDSPHGVLHQDFDQFEQFRFDVAPKIFFHFTPPADKMLIEVRSTHGRIPPLGYSHNYWRGYAFCFGYPKQLTQDRVHHQILWAHPT